MMRENIRDFLKRDVRIAFRRSVPLAALYLLCIPFIRGISNLDEAQSADCLLQSAALVGLILIVPVLKGELSEEIREVVRAKQWGYGRTVCVRIGLAFGLTAGMMLVFAAVMRENGCVFSFWRETLKAAGLSWLMGSAGLLASWLGKSLAAGYLAALGCYVILVFL